MSIQAIGGFERTGLGGWVRAQRITTQFLVAGGLIILVATALSGAILSSAVERNAISSTGGATALFVDAVAGSLVQDLGESSTLSAAATARLDAIFNEPAFRARFPFLEIWHPDGTIAYSNSPELIGRAFPLPEGARTALSGRVASSVTDLRASQHTTRNWTETYLEVYSPLREAADGRVIAVAEIHEISDELQATLLRLRLQTWLVVLLAGVAVMGGLYGIVASAARQIDDQRRSLDLKVVELEKASSLNLSLRQRIQAASEKLAEMNERYLRRLGAELHDGPAQLLGFAILNVEQLRRETKVERRRKLADEQERVLKEATSEIRNISRGLLLPDVLELEFAALIRRVIAIHEARTGSSVTLSLSGTMPELAPAAKICAFRFVQESLNNAFRHGAGPEQRVTVTAKDRMLTMSVANRTGARPLVLQSGDRLGLIGMRERIESLGGTLKVESAAGGETKITMELDSDPNSLRQAEAV
jgi:signal transduction histidine kinase